MHYNDYYVGQGQERYCRQCGGIVYPRCRAYIEASEDKRPFSGCGCGPLDYNDVISPNALQRAERLARIRAVTE